MRERWTRGTPSLSFTDAELSALLAPVGVMTSQEPATGGLANTNLRVVVDGAPLHVRFWVRDPAAAAKELALHALVADRVPVPRLLYAAPDNPISGHPFAVMTWVDAPRLETTPPDAAVARAVGATLASIHAFTFARHGFLDGTLRVVTPVSVGGAGLLGFLREVFVDGPGGARLGPELTSRVLACAEREGPLLDEWTGPPCLTHSDYNGSNILVRDGAVAAVLDWEFAFAGSPFVDLGNLLRPPRGDDATFVAAVADGYRAAGGVLPAAWRRMSELMDLLAWADFLSRPDPDAALVADARTMVARTTA